MKNNIIISLLFSLAAISCHYFDNREEKMQTPKEHLNDTKVDAVRYAEDKTLLKHQLSDLMDGHKQSFHSKEYFDSTKLEIDTILYDRSYQKVIVFILTQNPTNRQIVPNKEYSWYYDAYCYLGIRQNEVFKLKWMKPFSLINFYDRKEASEYIKEQYFTAFTTVKDAGGLLIHKYNLNDSRFWESPIWKESFGD